MAYNPWQFPDKWGYLNNPRWLPETGQPFMNRRAGDVEGYEEERHVPCGHWHKRIPGPTEAIARYIYTTFAIRVGDDYHLRVIKLNGSTGEVVWDQIHQATNYGYPAATNYPTGIAVDETGVYVSEICNDGMGHEYGRLEKRALSDGSLVWEQVVVGCSETVDGWAEAVCLTPSYVYIVGFNTASGRANVIERRSKDGGSLVNSLDTSNNGDSYRIEYHPTLDRLIVLDKPWTHTGHHCSRLIKVPPDLSSIELSLFTEDDRDCRCMVLGESNLYLGGNKFLTASPYSEVATVVCRSLSDFSLVWATEPSWSIQGPSAFAGDPRAYSITLGTSVYASFLVETGSGPTWDRNSHLATFDPIIGTEQLHVQVTNEVYPYTMIYAGMVVDDTGIYTLRWNTNSSATPDRWEDVSKYSLDLVTNIWENIYSSSLTSYVPQPRGWDCIAFGEYVTGSWTSGTTTEEPQIWEY